MLKTLMVAVIKDQLNTNNRFFNDENESLYNLVT